MTYNKAYYQAHEKLRRLKPEVKAQIRESSRKYHEKRYKTDPDYRKQCIEKASAYVTERYHNDPEYRAKVLARNRAYRESYYDILKSRRHFKELVEINPDKAKQILSEIEAEEGPAFRELLLDGIPEKLKLIGGY